MRVFIAGSLPEPVRFECSRLIDCLKPKLPNARWVPIANLHVTLAFLGEVATTDLLRPALDGICEGRRSLTLKLSKVGCFPRAQKARVVWAGLEGEIDALHRYVQEMRSALRDAGFNPDDKPFTAHVTLARLSPPSAAPIDGERVNAVEFQIHAADVYESISTPGGPRYSLIFSSPFE